MSIILYYVQNGKYYVNINNKKTEILSIETATDIAEKETKKTKYQYQSWKSEFYRGESIDNSISGELILGLDDLSKNILELAIFGIPYLII